MARVYVLHRMPEAEPHGLPLLAFSTFKKARDVCKKYFPFAARWEKEPQDTVARRNKIQSWVGRGDSEYPDRICGRIVSHPVDKGP